MEFKKKLFLIDGHALFHRAFHALPAMTNSQGFPTGAVFGFFSMLFKAISDIKPTHVLVVFDVPGETFRHKLAGDYKATRKAAPDELLMQLPKIKEILKALDIPVFEKAGFEADDLLGIISAKTPKDVQNIIVTGDLDMLQLIDEHTVVYRFKIGFSDIVIYDEEKMLSEFGIGPELWVDYKAIRGDASDNIPGVPGIGIKGALDLVKQFGKLEEIYKAAEKQRDNPDASVGAGKIKPGTAKKLLENKAKAFLSFKLAKIDSNHKLEFNLKDAEFSEYDSAKVMELFNELGIKTLIRRLPKVSQGKQTELMDKPAEEKVEKNLITDSKELSRLVRELKEHKLLAFKTTEDLVSISDGKHDFLAEVKGLKEIFENQNIAKIGHDLKQEYRNLKKFGIELVSDVFDTLIAAYLVNPGARDYNLPDNSAETVFKQFKKLEHELKENKLEKIFEEIEMPLMHVLISMEDRGIKLDLGELKKLSTKLDHRVKHLISEIHKMAGMEFNISSPIQLREVLFEKLQIPTQNLRKTGKTKALSTAAGELEKLRGLHPIIELIFEYRELTKLKSTYVDALPELVSKEDLRLHTSYNQTIAATGRLSSSDPNLQNIPIRSDLGNEVRKAFIAEEGYELLSLDYSQIELRIVASLSKDPEMVKIFTSDGDFHAATAARIFNVAEDKVTPSQRRDAKTINFSILYGVSAFGLSERTDMERAEAADYIKKYYEAFPKLKEYLDGIIVLAREQGFITNELGRIRYFSDISTPNYGLRSAAERAAINMPAQSLAADIIKLAMIETEKALYDENDCRMLLSVHDELVFEVKKGKSVDFAHKIKKIMESVYKLEVPLRVEAKVGANWGQMEKIE